MVLSAHDVELFEESRGRLEAIGYRILGSAGDAEDAVQDTFLRWQAADRDRIDQPVAWLTKVLTNLCLNQLTSARARRETYVGQWLPEPVLAGDPMLGPADTAEQRASVSIAVLTLMERLSGSERVVYVLREAFGHPHAEIAGILDISESNSQQLYRRAKQHLAVERARAVVDTSAAGPIVEEFLSAAVSGDTGPLVKLLAEDAVTVADGGGRVPARSTPIVGATGVARLFRGLFQPSAAKRMLAGGSVSLYLAVANGGPAVLAVAGDRVLGVLSIAVTSDEITAIRVQANVDKLDRLARRWATADRGEPFARLW